MNVCVLRPPLTFPEIRTATGLLISENVFTITQTTTRAAAAAAADVPAASVDIGGGACGDGGAVGGGAAKDAGPRLDSGACAACSSVAPVLWGSNRRVPGGLVLRRLT